MVCHEKEMVGTRDYPGWGRDSGSGGESPPKLWPDHDKAVQWRDLSGSPEMEGFL